MDVLDGMWARYYLIKAVQATLRRVLAVLNIAPIDRV